MINKINKLSCKVCGNIQEDPPWGEDGQCPTYDICDCYGTEFGYGDCTLKAIKTSRACWLAKGAQWKCLEEKPKDWCLREQLKNIPEIYR